MAERVKALTATINNNSKHTIYCKKNYAIILQRVWVRVSAWSLSVCEEWCSEKGSKRENLKTESERKKEMGLGLAGRGK